VQYSTRNPVTVVWAIISIVYIGEVGREREEGGAGKEGKGRGEKEGKERKRKETKVKLGGFVDGIHEWGREGSGDCGRVALEKSDVSKSSRIVSLEIRAWEYFEKKRTILAEAVTKITLSCLVLRTQ